MNTLTKKLVDYPEFFKDFIDWYGDNYKTGIALKLLIELDSDYMLPVVHKYLNKVYNVGVMFDTYTYYAFIINPELRVNELIKNFNENGEFTHVIIKDTNSREANINTVFERALLRVVEEITKEF